MTSERATRRPGPGRPGYDLDSLLSVAVKVFNEKGYDGTSMEVLATRLGITKSSIYHHVSSKEELLELALSRALNALFAATTEPEATSGSSVSRLEHLVRRSVQVLVAELPYVTLLLRVRGNSAIERRALTRRREFDEFVATLAHDAAAEGDLRPDIDPALISRLLFGMVNSLIEWYRPRSGADTDQLADAVVAMTFDGLRTHPRRRHS
ncbi:TetR/AcrR family transcriptional regulator [Nocardia araoensis]|uniref:TetR/AcrR family transcriptional regulator n=1 Tax=Nocardia araoensis TaxID=228600 RepID=UPI0003091798|nr:TetR/AcrR family transcriptional regulator [Nocardia araoensis]